MANFPEQVIKEYEPIIKRETPTKDVKYRIRVVKRQIDGLFRLLVDIREYVITEKRFGFTESGVYFNKEELDYLIKTLQEARREFDGSHPSH